MPGIWHHSKLNPNPKSPNPGWRACLSASISPLPSHKLNIDVEVVWAYTSLYAHLQDRHIGLQGMILRRMGSFNNQSLILNALKLTHWLNRFLYEQGMTRESLQILCAQSANCLNHKAFYWTGSLMAGLLSKGRYAEGIFPFWHWANIELCYLLYCKLQPYRIL